MHTQGRIRRWWRLGGAWHGLLRAAVALGVAAWSIAACARTPTEPVLYDWFAYSGHDAAFAQPLPKGDYRNPILAGFHPDPSVVRVGKRFYMVNSSFAYYPGVPVFASRDLVHWRQVGAVIDRPAEFHYAGLGVSRGVFAPDISYHDGVFYVVNTFMDGGGTFVATAKDPAGSWSDPVWLPSVDGIDPSLFFDADGSAYLLYSGEPPGGAQYAGQRALWLQHFDPATLRLVGPRKVVLHGGVDSDHPVWAEGPHLYQHAGWYYLAFAQGGTSLRHSEMVMRSHSPWGPFQPDPHNPILTQRDLPAGRAQPIINAGHADLVETADGSWWAVFLASRAYDQVHFNTGRETFLLPVHWQAGWPVILPHGQVVPRVVKGPSFMEQGVSQAPLSGNFDWRDDFKEATLRQAWLYLRAPMQAWLSLGAKPGWLAIDPLAAGLDSTGNPSFLARRQQHLAFAASTALEPPAQPGVDAGIALFQNEHHWYFLGARRADSGLELFLQEDAGGSPRVIARAHVAVRGELRLKIVGDRGRCSFAYATPGGDWHWLVRDADATILSTDVAGGFVGAVVGPYARLAAGGPH